MEKQQSHVFRNKNFNLLLGGVLVSNIAHILFNFAISLYILGIAGDAFGRGNAALTQGLYLALSGLVLVIAVPFGGSLADRFDKVKIMWITDFLRGFVILAVAWVLWTEPGIYTLLAVLFAMNVILAINGAFFNPASSSLLRFIVPDHLLQQASSLLRGSANIQNIIGLVLGGIIYATMDIEWIFAINGLGYIISAATEIFITYDKSDHVSKNSEKKRVFSDIKEGFFYLRGEKAVLYLLLGALAINFFVSPIYSNAMPYFIEFKLALTEGYLFSELLKPANWYSIIMATFSISALIMSLIYARKKTQDKYASTIKFSMFMFAVILSFQSILMILYYINVIEINPVLVMLTIVSLTLGIFNIMLNVPVTLILQRNVDKDKLGKVSSLATVLSQALIPIGSLTAGLLISQISIVSFYFFSLFGTIVATTWVIRNKTLDTL